MAEDRQIPDLFGLLAAGVGQRPTNVARYRVAQPADWFGENAFDLAGLDRGDLLAAKRVTQHTQVHVGDLRATPDALLDTEEHLDDHQRGQCPQIQLPGLGHTLVQSLDGPDLPIMIGIVVLLAVLYATPFLAGIENLIGLLIIGFALYEAWKLNRRTELRVSGPQQVSAARAPA